MRTAALLVFAANILYLFVTLDQLPDPLAVHFGRGGKPDGWMTHGAHAAFMCMLVGIFALAFLGMPWLLRRLPDRMINIPHRDYWLSPGRRDHLQALLARFCHIQAVFIGLFFLLMQYLLLKANLSVPVRLDHDLLLGSLVVFLLGLLVPGVTLILRLRRRRD